MKSSILLLLSSVLVSCGHQRIDGQYADPVNNLHTHAASEPLPISYARANGVKIDPTKPPNGMQMIQILLENQSLSVKGTSCESDPFGVGDRRRLQHKLAMTLGYAFDRPKHHAVLSGSCEADQFQPPSGPVVDIWRCNLAVVEKDERDEFIASSNIYFGLKKDTWEFIPEKLLCT